MAVKATMSSPVLAGIEAARVRGNACFVELMGSAANAEALADFNRGG
jgi:hypothetical protein